MTDRLRRLPLGVRIAVLTSGTLVVLLVLVGLLVQRQFRAVLRDEIDRSLIERARAAADVPPRVATRPDLPTYVLERFQELQRSQGSSDELQVISDTGSVLAASGGLMGEASLVTGGALVRVAAGVPVRGDATIDGVIYRFVGIHAGNPGGHTVVAATPIRQVHDTESALLGVYVPLAILAAAIAAVAGMAIARSSLAPLRAFASEADAIGSLDLSQRLSTPPTADEIGRLGATLNRMLDRLDAALRRERQLTAEVGHELRTPLAIIRAETELLLVRVSEEAAIASLESVLEEIDRTTGVIDDMLLLARADAEVAFDHPDRVELGALARTVAARFSVLAAGRGLSLEASGEGCVEGDPRGMERAITNLVENALRHTPVGGTVRLRVQQRDRGALLVVDDSGPGVPPDALGLLFDRYARAGPHKGAAGLGLSIVAAVAASHHGSVRARNRPEGGLEISVEFQGSGREQHRDRQ